MSTHPNTLLILKLTPDDLPWKTLREIRDAANANDEGDVLINGTRYHSDIVPADGYLDAYQIDGKEGCLVFFAFVTYGYGQFIIWSELEKKKNLLQYWAQAICDRYRCTYEIVVAANYW